MQAGDQMGLVSTISSESTLVNPSSPAAQSTPPVAAPAGAAPALDLNSPPPSSGSSRSSSTSSSSSPPRSATPPPPPSSPAPPPSTARKPATPAASTAQSDPDPLKQQLASTTFIQADVLSFRELVQRHTGAAEDAQDKMPVTLPARQSGAKNNQSQAQQAAAAAGQNDSNGVVAPPPPHGTPHGTNPFRRHHMSRLHERKVNNLRNLEVSRASPFKRTGCSPRGAADGPSPKLLYAASGMLPSPVTPLSSDASFETTSNPSPVPQMPLTPTETLRREFASALHCGGGGEESQGSQIKGLAPASSPGYVNGGGVLERFPFLHHHQSFHHHQQQQQQQQQQMSPVVMHTGLQLAAHYQQQNHIIYEQQQHHHQQQQNHVMYEQQQQQMMMMNQQREPELLDLFPVHATSLKESRC